jgi:hypothetical protein
VAVGAVSSCLLVFLMGVLGKVVCSGWLFCGDVVVNCVVDVDGGMGVFR